MTPDEARLEGQRMAHALAACKTDAEVDAFVKELRAHPLVKRMEVFMPAVSEKRAQIERDRIKELRKEMQ